jgi:hypothetical protein
MILVAGAPGGPLSVLAFDTSERVAFNVAEDELDLLILYYPRPLAEMALVAGAISQEEQLHQRPLPKPVRAASGVLGAKVEMIEVEDARATELFLRARIIEPLPETCALAGGCYTTDEDQLCVIPCDQDAPVVERPHPLLTLPSATCPWVQVAFPDGDYIPEELKGITGCEPLPKATCTKDQIALPGRGSCVAASGACLDIFASELPLEGVVFVDLNAVEPYAGTREAPFPTIGRALLESTRGSTIALAAGTYEEPLRVTGEFTIRGACADTVLSGAIEVASATVAFRNMTLASQVVVDGGSTLDLAELVVTTTLSVGQYAFTSYGRLRVAETLFRDPRGRLFAIVAGSAVLRNFEVRNGREAFVVSSGGSLTVYDGTIGNGSSLENAMYLNGTVHTDLARLLIEGNGVSAGGHAIINAKHLRIRADSTRLRIAMQATGSAVLSIADSLIGPMAGQAVVATEQTHLSLKDSIVAGIALDVPGGYAHALVTTGSPTLFVARTAFLSMEDNAVEIDTTRSAHFEDVVIGGMGDKEAAALIVRGASTITIDRMIIVESLGHAIRVKGELSGPSFTANDLTIRTAVGGAMELARGANVVASRMRMEQSGAFGIFAYENVRATFRDLSVFDVRAGSGPSCELGCPGSGIHASIDTALTVERFELLSCNIAGARVSSNGLLQLRNGRIEGSFQALALDSRETDIRALLSGVVFRNNSEILALP